VSLLRSIEQLAEEIVEGSVRRALGPELQPVELANRILKDMEANRTVGVHEVWVPNHFAFVLSPPDYEKFQQTEKALRRELEQVVRDAAEERGWGLVGPAEVEFRTDDSLKQGDFLSEPSLVEGPTSSGRPIQAPVSTPSPDEGAELVIIEKGRDGTAFPLAKDRVIIGRLAESDVVVPDPGASRRHAEVRRQDGEFVISDLGSMNGTRVNEAAIGERTLQPGDRITIGRTVLEFRRG